MPLPLSAGACYQSVCFVHGCTAANLLHTAAAAAVE